MKKSSKLASVVLGVVGVALCAPLAGCDSSPSAQQAPPSGGAGRSSDAPPPRSRFSAVLEQDGKVLVIRRSEDEYRAEASFFHFFTNLVVCPSGRCLYVVKNLGAPMSGSQSVSVVRFQLPGDDLPLSDSVKEVVLSNGDVREHLKTNGWISDLDGASDDGDRLLLRLAMEEREDETSRRYLYRPFVYDVSQKRLERVRP